MKRSIDALSVPRSIVASVVAALVLAAAASAALAVSPVVKLSGSAHLTKSAHGSTVGAAVFHVDTVFSTDTPGAPLFTLQRAVVYFPDHAGTNGPLFPTCSARQIARFHGNLARCPKGSRVGQGTVKAQALQLGVTASGSVTMFNSDHGRSVAVNIKTYLPAYIDQTLVQLHGRYGEKLTFAVPPSLQQILDGVFVGVQDFDVTVTGSVRRRGVIYSYLKARTCPTTPLHGAFDFVDGTTGQTASATVDTRVRCSTG